MLNDTPSSYSKERLDYLIANKIPAILFCKGNNMEERPEIVAESIRNGFIIGNHSYTHPHFSQLELIQCEEEISKADRIIEEAYYQVSIKRPEKLFMFPFFDNGTARSVLHKKRLQDVLKNQDYKNLDTSRITYPFFKEEGLHLSNDVYCTLNFQEWKNPNLDDLLKKIDSPDNLFGGDLSDYTSADLLLMHDNEKTNPSLFPAIIDKLVARGDISFELPNF